MKLPLRVLLGGLLVTGVTASESSYSCTDAGAGSEKLKRMSRGEAKSCADLQWDCHDKRVKKHCCATCSLLEPKGQDAGSTSPTASPAPTSPSSTTASLDAAAPGACVDQPDRWEIRQKASGSCAAIKLMELCGNARLKKLCCASCKVTYTWVAPCPTACGAAESNVTQACTASDASMGHADTLCGIKPTTLETCAATAACGTNSNARARPSTCVDRHDTSWFSEVSKKSGGALTVTSCADARTKRLCPVEVVKKNCCETCYVKPATCADHKYQGTKRCKDAHFLNWFVHGKHSTCSALKGLCNDTNTVERQKLRKACPKTCGVCGAAADSTAPSTAPSLAPTSAPTVDGGSDAPTGAPTAGGCTAAAQGASQEAVLNVVQQHFKDMQETYANFDFFRHQRPRPWSSPSTTDSAAAAAKWTATDRLDLLDDYLGAGQYEVNQANMAVICGDLMVKLEHNITVCGQPYTADSNYTLNCDNRGHPCQSKPRTRGGGGNTPSGQRRLRHGGRKDWQLAGKNYSASDLTAVLDVCVTPCMRDRSQSCCAVPGQIASHFACCREGCKCPDQQDRRRAQSSLGPRKAQVSVSVTVTVEETSSSASVYDALLRCLQNPANLDAMCLTGSSGH